MVFFDLLTLTSFESEHKTNTFSYKINGFISSLGAQKLTVENLKVAWTEVSTFMLGCFVTFAIRLFHPVNNSLAVRNLQLIL
jgi:hypothetical protein